MFLHDNPPRLYAFTANLEKFVERPGGPGKNFMVVCGKSPSDVKIVMQSELPMTADITKSHPFSGNVIHALNARIKEFASLHQVVFVDFASLVSSRAGDFDSSFTFDGTHPNGKVYAKLETVLAPYVMAEQDKRQNVVS